MCWYHWLLARKTCPEIDSVCFAIAILLDTHSQHYFQLIFGFSLSLQTIAFHKVSDESLCVFAVGHGC